MICKHCGAPVEDELFTCPVCGGSLPEECPEEENAPAEVRPADDAREENSPAEAPELPAEASEAEAGADAEAPEPQRKGGPLWLLIVLGVAVIAAVVLLVMSLSGGKDEPAGDPQAEPPSSEAAAAPSPAAEPAEEAGEEADFKTYAVPGDQITAEQAMAIAATFGGKELNNTELSYYYWNQFYSWANAYGEYLYYFLDPSQPLASQSYDDDRSWEDFFLEAALETWRQTSALVEAANEAGFQLDKENQAYLENVPQTLADNAKNLELESGDDFLRKLYGPYASVEGYTEFVRDSLVSYGYLNELYASIQYGEEDVSAWFDQNGEKYAGDGLSKDEPNLVNVRHILIKPAAAEDAETDENGDPVVTDGDKAAARQQAEELLAEWQAGPATEESFAQLASANTEDPGSAGNGGLYEGVYPGEMVPAFNDWCFDEARQPGDTGIVETDYGYHIMYFSATQDHAHWYETAEEDYTKHLQEELLDGVVGSEQVEPRYGEIVLPETTMFSDSGEQE